MIQQMADLNDKMVVLTSRVEEQNNHISIMQSDIHRMVDLLTEMVEIFRVDEPAKASVEEKKVAEVDPPASTDVKKVDLTGNSDEEGDLEKKVVSDVEEDNSESDGKTDEKSVSDAEDRD